MVNTVQTCRTGQTAPSQTKRPQQLQQNSDKKTDGFFCEHDSGLKSLNTADILPAWSPEALKLKCAECDL